jgi:hypothetical protein
MVGKLTGLTARYDMRITATLRRLNNGALNFWVALLANAHQVGLGGRPAGTLEARTFPAATRATCTSAQFVTGSIWPPSDESDRASERRMMLAVFAPRPNPRRGSL